MKFTIRGKNYEIDRSTIIQATKGVTPKDTDGRNKFYVELNGHRYPIKQLTHLVTGLPYTDGFTSQDARRNLTKLGFEVRYSQDGNTLKPVDNVNTGNTMKFGITLENDEDGFVVASCPALPGCHSQGKTKKEAIANIREAIRGYIASMRRHGEPVPAIKEVREVKVLV